MDEETLKALALTGSGSENGDGGSGGGGSAVSGAGIDGAGDALSDGSTTGSSGDLSAKLESLEKAVAHADVDEDAAVLRAAAVRL